MVTCFVDAFGAAIVVDFNIGFFVELLIVDDLVVVFGFATVFFVPVV